MPIDSSLEGTQIALGWAHGGWKIVPHLSGSYADTKRYNLVYIEQSEHLYYSITINGF